MRGCVNMSQYERPLTHSLLASICKFALIPSVTSNVTHEELRKRNTGSRLNITPSVSIVHHRFISLLRYITVLRHSTLSTLKTPEFLSPLTTEHIPGKTSSKLEFAPENASDTCVLPLQKN